MERKTLKIEFNGIAEELCYYTLTGKKPGKRIVISGGMHGNEVNGVHNVKMIMDWAIDSDLVNVLEGEIIFIPVLNISGFESQQRYVQHDNKDLNRSFGIDSPTTFSEKLAKTLSDEIFSKCDFGIDFHDSGGNLVLLPHSRVHKENAGLQYCSRDFGQLFGTEIILEREGEKGMLAVEMKKKYGLTFLTVEIGGALKVYREFEKYALQGVKNILAYFQMHSSEIKTPEKQYILMDRFGVESAEACEIEFYVQVGDKIKEGQVIGKVYYPQQFEVKELISPFTGFVFSRLQANHSMKRQTIYSVLETEKCVEGICYLDQFIQLPKFNLRKVS